MDNQLHLPWIHRVFSLFKRFALGVYHGVRRKHLQRYLEEFVFRFNCRSGRQRAFDTLIGITTTVGPATYRQIVQQTDQWTLPLVVATKGASAAQKKVQTKILIEIKFTNHHVPVAEPILAMGGDSRLDTTQNGEAPELTG